MMQVRASTRCRSCQAPIRWVLTEPNGRKMPLDPDPVPDGNVWIIRYQAGTPVVGVALNSDGVPPTEAFRYVSHFVTCPDRDEWRHPKPKQGELDV